MGNVVRRMAARAACAVLKERVAAAVGPHQYGVGRSAGCELVHKCITALVDEDRSRVVLAFDASNAFGSLPRQRVWEGVRARLPELSLTVAGWLAGPTTHVFWDDTGSAHPLRAAAGVDQGCPLSPLLFAVGIAAALESMDRQLRALDASARVFAYLDDIVVVVNPAHAEAAHTIVQEAMTAHGLTVNAGKTKVWSLDVTLQLPPSLVPREVSELRLLGADVRFLDRQEDRDELGAPIHGSVNGTAVVEAARGLTRRLEELRGAGLRTKTAYTVLHTYAQSCCNHFQRANYEVGSWVDDLESVLHQGLAVLVGEDLDQCRRDLAGLRLKEGGLAFGGLRRRSAPAFLASWALVLQQVAGVVGASSLEGFRARCPMVWNELGRAERELREAGGNGGQALNWLSWFEAPAAKLQGVWGRELSACLREAVLRPLPDAVAADVRSHGGPGAGSFLLPAQEGVDPMPNQHFAIALRDRLVLPVCQEGARCQHRRRSGVLCGAFLDARGHHARKCNIGGALGTRHDRLRDRVAKFWTQWTRSHRAAGSGVGH